ncbi:MAG TPA: transcriptional regulator [Cyanobacteria bacterium UBA11149]|nr:transcriptional regulator [Cyanobacteria bacterium UBA11367]HBE58448.1 transcriptional regulator [Cyanobacteria bacterium UBA11366]HBK65499.1 transcriptional regulator [Cyanobacteria bacterium UBA11166]HBR73475.1 transcriptional regulator [Cyanobacteria bacterium UBA11159]HBS71808.1 transcriptional regulator [Cyanobacteria bacterium UBA11153]HBW90761.1 transcriptional regulator [Cyanobacteria bacterium UBA11149]HCA94264.1 transcriptional regulator [Cyanobacteria bacterium UBA9226]
MKILLVEDDCPTASALADTLAAYQYGVDLATDGEMGLNLAESFEYDLVLLDIILPKLDGISLCRQLRAEGYQMPILMLTAKDTSSDRVLGLEAGADDYLVKPFDLSELIARIRALLRRGKGLSSPVITWENVSFDSTNSEVTCDRKPLHLTPKEYCLLELFLLNPKRIFSRSSILDRLWDFAESPGEETVSSHIYSLRQKFKAAGASDMIETVHGLGYRLKAPSTINTDSPPKKQVNSSRRWRALETAKRVGEKFKHQFLEQVEVLEKAANLLKCPGKLTPYQQQKAEQTAHKLAGSLGIFGLWQGSALAREIEELLQKSETLVASQVHLMASHVRSLRQSLDNASLTTSPEAKDPVPLLLIVNNNLSAIEQVKVTALSLGMRVEVARDMTILMDGISKQEGFAIADIIIFNVDFSNPPQSEPKLFTELTDILFRIPVIFVPEKESLFASELMVQIISYLGKMRSNIKG